MAIVPPVMGPSGNKKLSKRDGAKDILDYAREGYLPEALINFMASLGWNDGTEQEIFSVQEIIDKFSLDRVQHAGARFDEQRLLWMNGAHIRALSIDDLYDKVEGFWPPEAEHYDADYRKQVLGLVQERLKYFGELPELSLFFFKDLPINPALWQENKQLKKLDQSEIKNLLEQAEATLAQSDFSVDDLTERLNNLLETTGQKPGVLFSLIRIATTQAPSSPGLADTLHVLRKETSLLRLRAMLLTL
jgi:glutamyl-tRNA synthetase